MSDKEKNLSNLSTEPASSGFTQPSNLKRFAVAAGAAGTGALAATGVAALLGFGYKKLTGETTKQVQSGAAGFVAKAVKKFI